MNTKKAEQQTKPFVSVVMPVYNAGAFLQLALDSILNQTYKHFEFIIVDDHSTDGSYQLLKTYAKKHNKITLLRNRKNQGVSITVKKAIDLAKGDFIARMDADDIAMPTRLEKQVEYLLKHKKTVAVGTQCYLIDKNNRIIGEKTFPTKYKDVYQSMFAFIPVQQPTLMIAKDRLPHDFMFYRDGLNTAEEVELFFKLFLCGRVENLKEKLLFYRMHEHNTSFLDVRKTFYLTLLSRVQAIFIYKYKPSVKGVFITIAQTVLISILPTAVTLWLYKMLRKMVIDVPEVHIDQLPFVLVPLPA